MEEISLKKEKLEMEKDLRTELELKYRSDIVFLAGELENLAKTVDNFNRQINELKAVPDLEPEFAEKTCFIDVNTASKEDLQKLTGIGPVLAQRITDSRPFSSVYDLIKVSGIGEAVLQKIIEQGCAYVKEADKEEEFIEEEEGKGEEERITAADVCPVNINTASKENLEAITGIGPVLSQRIIESRPFYSVDDLLKVSGIGQATLEKIKFQGCAYASGYAAGSKSASSFPVKPELKPEISLFYPEENPVNREVEVIFSASGLKNASYDIKISIEKNGVLSQIYNQEKEGEDKWQSSVYYLNEVFSGTSFEGQFRLKIRDDKDDFQGEAEIIARARETGKTGFSEFKGKINIIEPGEEADEKEEQEEQQEKELPINLLLNEFFEEHINGEFTNWVSNHGKIKVSEDALVGSHSMNISHSYKYGEGRDDEQDFYYSQAENQEIIYYGEIRAKGVGDVRIGILRPGYSTYNYGEWEIINTDEWVRIFHEIKGEREGEKGSIRIQHRQSQGKDETNLLIGAAWLGVAEPPQNWISGS